MTRAQLLSREPYNCSLEGNWQQAYWFRRFSEEPLNPVVRTACVQQSRVLPLDWLLDELQITKIPIISRTTQKIVGMWECVGSKPRPQTGRFFERWNDSLRHFDLWLYRAL